jgi:hypothetical protein
MTEPTTAAGKRLLGDVKACLGAEGYLGYHVTPDAIAAIENEARWQEHERLARVAWAEPVATAERAVAAALARVREAVEELPDDCHSEEGSCYCGSDINPDTPISRTAVLAIIEEETRAE